ncbi:MAG TPA: ATP-binding cassette domain-containing protein, partial [Acidimicrobiales bacterium]|nr:ATP-binding cassette domain-containing protein [Acidimicrobiales bacterium]
VLRGGKTVLEGRPATDFTDGELVEYMVGRAVPNLPAERPTIPSTTPALKLTGLRVPGDGGRAGVVDLDLEIAQGEIVGVAGVAGSGQRELTDAVVGAREWTAGSIVIAGAAIGAADPRQAIAAGASGVPEDPVGDWVVPGLSVLEHLALAQLKLHQAAPSDTWLHKPKGLDWPGARRTARKLDEAADLRMAGVERVVATLSGGNIQRVLLTQVLGSRARLYVLSYPNRGLDVASTRQVQQLILAKRESGAGILLVSEDLDELMAMSDRIAVLHAGHLAGIVKARDTTRAELGHLMLSGEAVAA